jgi:hypothetical protein
MTPAERAELDAMRRHLADVEAELARYAAAYGLSDRARNLMTVSPLAATPKQTSESR